MLSMIVMVLICEIIFSGCSCPLVCINIVDICFCLSFLFPIDNCNYSKIMPLSEDTQEVFVSLGQEGTQSDIFITNPVLPYQQNALQNVNPCRSWSCVYLGTNKGHLTNSQFVISLNLPPPYLWKLIFLLASLCQCTK
jgi:hypothetical protein